MLTGMELNFEGLEMKNMKTQKMVWFIGFGVAVREISWENYQKTAESVKK